MPQLVKGGKYIFGWVCIQPDGRIRIHEEAFHEYRFRRGEKIIIMSGSKTSGGFSIMKRETLSASVMGQKITDVIRSLHSRPSFPTERTPIAYAGNRLISQAVVDHEMKVGFSAELLHRLGLKTGEKLLVGRGSGLGPAFIARGQIYAAALKHNHISDY